ncbi:Mitogen-activated protein kinase kinase kinase 7, partial [Perkinsus olseni]
MSNNDDGPSDYTAPPPTRKPRFSPAEPPPLRRPALPRKGVALAFFLFIVGVVFLLTGLKVFWQISTLEAIPFTTLGAICFIPGAYHVYLIYHAVHRASIPQGRTQTAVHDYRQPPLTARVLPLQVPVQQEHHLLTYRGPPSHSALRQSSSMITPIPSAGQQPTTTSLERQEMRLERCPSTAPLKGGYRSSASSASTRPSPVRSEGVHVPPLSRDRLSDHRAAAYLAPPAPYPVFTVRQPTVMRRTVSVAGVGTNAVHYSSPLPLGKRDGSGGNGRPSREQLPRQQPPAPSNDGRTRRPVPGILQPRRQSMAHARSATSLVAAPVTRLSSMDRVRRQARITQPTPREAVNLESSLHESSQKIAPSELAFEQELGAGEFGQVFRGSYKGKEVAIKRLYYDASRMASARHGEQIVKDLVREVESFRHLDHPGLVRFLGACLELPHLCLVTEYMPGGNLHQLLHVRRVRLSRGQRLKMAIQLTDAVAYLHAQNPVIVHRDLKTMNVVLDREMNAKLCDFGLTEPMEFTHITRKSNGGSPRYMAPELFDERLR